jgi:hypothetical protein
MALPKHSNLMNDDEFNEYIKFTWSFLIHKKGLWGGNPEAPVHRIGDMDKSHLEKSIAMIHRWHVPLPVNESDKTRLEELKQKKLDELEQALKRITS